MKILGIESSCDDTSVAIVEDGVRILGSKISSQIEIHRRFGGVVPEVASRKHLEALLPILKEVLEEASLELSDIDLFASTAGPGLIGPLLVGLSAAKAAAWFFGKPFLPVHHLEAHLTAAFLSNERLPSYPFIGIIISGGHSSLVLAKAPRNYEILARTIDDAPGELYDKIARYLGLGYPGGPVIQKIAENGDSERYSLPEPLKNDYARFSFSGLKTAVIRLAEKEKNNLSVPDLCASLQKTVAEVIGLKLEHALQNNSVKTLAIAGGVAANVAVRAKADELSRRYGLDLYMPSLKLCTDNAAMVAAHAYLIKDSANPETLNAGAVSSIELGSDWN
ncbi:MAG: tRNA (adenosine(37)-N6)-threonylcarbamoyltransferase complex transferase subunit TsaD [Candidatus Riflebacteria bacterium]|nr:tRNA (adenosine(37)-N6)-threonylcarbamoyltransferase complex transferase subunit TsaD [Candidatus Riflebacteria bacterium]